MTFDARETSRYDGKPIEIYTFRRDYLAWRYTSAPVDVVADTHTYTAISIRRTEIELTNELNRSGMTITVPRDNDVADLFRVVPPSDPVTLVLAQYHAGDDEVATIWSGRVINVKWRGSLAEIILEPIYTSVRRTGLRRRYQKSCPHVLYGNGCKLAAGSWRSIGTVSSIIGAVILTGAAAVHPDGYYSGGFVEWEVEPGIYDRRFIIGHVGSQLTLSMIPYGLAQGANINIYPGCDHTMATCGTKFSNVLNYGGMPYIPEKNPFGGDPIY